MHAEHLDRLAREAQRLQATHLRDLLAMPERFETCSRRLGPLLFDFSRQRLDERALGALLATAAACDWPARRDAMFRGEIVNLSECRAALHTALRAAEATLPSLTPEAVTAEVEAALARVERFVDAIHAGREDFGLAPNVTDVVNLGIGGSDLGPRLAVEALSAHGLGRVRCHFLPNVDGHATAALMRTLDPRRTLVLLVSKSFTTQETLLNGTVLRDWIRAAHGGDAARAARHFVAVSANREAALAFGVPAERVLPMWDYVGGRYSVWSAVGLVLALAIGMPAFRAFLRGAASIDDHFRSAAPADNLPLLLALIATWNRNVLGLPSQAVVPYHDALRELPAYLQQLEMESLGKSTCADGSPVASATAPVVWGHVGTNAQHAFFQALHQGTDVVPVDFIGVIRPDHDLHANHAALLANLLAQGEALARGRTREEALAGQTGASAEALARQRTFPGNRPSSTLLLDALTPETLGALLALYEHKVFMQSVLWGVNAFDQWGVELGKTLAGAILPALSGNAACASPDASTRGLLEAIRARR